MKALKKIMAALASMGIWTVKKVGRGAMATVSWAYEKAHDAAEWVIDDAIPAVGHGVQSIAMLPFAATGAAAAALVKPLLAARGASGGGVGQQTAAALNAAADQAKAAARTTVADADTNGAPSPGRVVKSVAVYLVSGRAVPDRLLEAMKPSHSAFISGLEPDELDRLSKMQPGQIAAVLAGQPAYGVPSPAEVEAREDDLARAEAANDSGLGQRIHGYRNARKIDDFRFDRTAAANAAAA